MACFRSGMRLMVLIALVSTFFAHASFATIVHAADSPPAILTPEEQALTSLLLAARNDAGVRQLTVDPMITLLAEDRSADMAAHNDFSHTPQDGDTIFKLLDRYGIAYRAVGETLTMNQNYTDTVAEAAGDLMRSPLHRATLLDSRYTSIGIGHAIGANGAHYFAVILLSS